MVRNIELQTETKIVTNNTDNIVVGGMVPTGMKRWVTFVEFDSLVVTAGSQVGLYCASVIATATTGTSMIATGNRKLMAYRRATGCSGARKGPLKIPKVPSVDNPLFSIAAGKYLGLFVSITTAQVTVQYFDE